MNIMAGMHCTVNLLYYFNNERPLNLNTAPTHLKYAESKPVFGAEKKQPQIGQIIGEMPVKIGVFFIRRNLYSDFFA